MRLAFRLAQSLLQLIEPRRVGGFGGSDSKRRRQAFILAPRRLEIAGQTLGLRALLRNLSAQFRGRALDRLPGLVCLLGGAGDGGGLRIDLASRPGQIARQAFGFRPLLLQLRRVDRRSLRVLLALVERLAQLDQLFTLARRLRNQVRLGRDMLQGDGELTLQLL